MLALFDGPIYGTPLDGRARHDRCLGDRCGGCILRGIDVGDRWEAARRQLAPIAAAGNYAFNDAHAMMAFVGAGGSGASATLLDAQIEAMARDDDNAAFTRDVGHPGWRWPSGVRPRAITPTTVRLLRPIRTMPIASAAATRSAT